MDIGLEVEEQIFNTITHSGLAGFLEFRAHQDPATLTPAYIQIWIELWIKDSAEQLSQRAYLKIEEQRNRINPRERTAYWYSLIDKRDPKIEYYDGLHFHADPPRYPEAVVHRKITENGRLLSWTADPSQKQISLPEAIRALLSIYWQRSLRLKGEV